MHRGIAIGAALILAACTADTPPEEPAVHGPRRGGTLRVAVAAFPFAPLGSAASLDPAVAYTSEAWELFRCCLARTLMSYNGKPTAEGGAELRPDLALEAPDVSTDGLTWSFRIRPGLRYSPPLENLEITTRDIVRAVERTARLGMGYSFYYADIQGFGEFVSGGADSISGLETPDAHTLVVRLNVPQGDLGFRFSLAATAPLPAIPGNPEAPFGVAEGHDRGLGPFLVSSGPYMLEGSADLDPSAPPDQQAPAGFRPGEEMTLVRNPSWRAQTDPLREAYVDRIELAIGGTVDETYQALDAGDVDLVMFVGPPPQVPPEMVDRYRADPDLGRLVFEPRDTEFFISMNLAVPPFDDLQVRKAVSYAIDKAAILKELGGPLYGRVATHLTPDSLTRGDLVSYDPYASPDHGGSLDDARGEMAQSAYDADGDGRCDAQACKDLVVLELAEFNRPVGPIVQANLAEIGISIEVDVLDADAYFGRLGDPAERVPMGLTTGWGKDYPDASGWLVPLFSSVFLGDSNYTLLGATEAQLREWGYSVRSVPSVDERLDQCLGLVGSSQTQCWTAVDQYLMEEVVPAVPYVVENHVQLIPDRIASYSFDQFTTMPALDRIALE